MLFDDRSACYSRTTGWERYVREIRSRLGGRIDIDLYLDEPESTATRILSDLRVAATAGEYRVAHFPSFPPMWIPNHTSVVYTVHDLTWWTHPETASRLGRHYYARLARTAVHRSHVVTPSQAVADEVVARLRVPEDRVTAVPLGTSLPPPAGVWRPTSGDYVLTVATLEPRKNLGRLVEAYQGSALAGQADLVVVGRRAWGEVPRGVHIVSGLTDQQLADAYAGARAVVMPSVYEGFGLPIVEALSLGTPVVCSDIRVFREVTGGHARFFDPTSVDSIRTALNEIDDSQISRGARAWGQSFTWDRTVDSLSRLYADLAQS